MRPPRPDDAMRRELFEDARHLRQEARRIVGEARLLREEAAALQEQSLLIRDGLDRIKAAMGFSSASRGRRRQT